jgi:phosphate-selective porin OprO/OprP
VGPFGLLGEYAVSSQRVERMEAITDLQHRAWNVTASLVLTGERAAYEGVVPLHPIELHHSGVGALEIVGRYSELRFDPDAFPIFADPTISVAVARELAGGLNWYMTDFVRLMLTFEHTEFAGGAAGGNRTPEDALLGRLQLAL